MAADGTPFTDLPSEELAPLLAAEEARYREVASRGLSLDLTRGKPAPAQLDLSNDLLTAVTSEDYRAEGGLDTRNYGGLEGLPELRAIFAELLGVPADRLLAQGNASLSLMSQMLTFAVLHGVADSATPWGAGPRKLICPVPGYDRHFSLAQDLGFEMITVDLDGEGPVLEQVAELVKDPAVKGIWAVPVHSNPSGLSYSRQRAQDLLALNAAAEDFTVLWDNAYALHHLSDDIPDTLDILGIAEEAGHPNRVFTFASTSKITFAGAGVAFLGSSPENIRWFTTHLGTTAIGPDKINQLRHVRFFGDADGVRAHMRRHREIVEPKFAIAREVLHRELGEAGIATWTDPKGGYFITVDVLPGTASRVVKLAGEAGVALTPAGASHPYGLDPLDTTIRLAPTFPTEEDLRAAVEAFAVCVRLAAAEKLAAG